MTRRRVTSKEARRLLAANELASIVKRKSPRKKQFGKTIELLIEEATERAKEAHWDDAKPSVLVGLYAYCHAEVYGSPPLELRGETLRKATVMAASFLKKEFAGDVAEMVEFMRWAWRRERGREDYRIKKGTGGGRISWQNQFVHRYLLTDYRVDRERQKGNQ